MHKVQVEALVHRVEDGTLAAKVPTSRRDGPQKTAGTCEAGR
jgi:hypothetical protein